MAEKRDHLKAPLSVRLPAEQDKWVREIAAERGVPVNVIVKTAIGFFQEWVELQGSGTVG